MRLIASLIITLALSFNLFAVDIPQFKNKIAIDGSAFYTTDKNGNIERINFVDYSFYSDKYEYILLDKPTTNIFFFDKVNPKNTNELHYYSIMEYGDNELYTNYHTFKIEDDILIKGYINEESDSINWDGPYSYNASKSIAIFVDYDKYGKKYIENLMNRDENKDFEGKYVSEDGKLYFTLKRLDGNTFYVEGNNPYYNLVVDNAKIYSSTIIITIIELAPDEEYYYTHITINALDDNTLIVFEYDDISSGFSGIYTKVRE